MVVNVQEAKTHLARLLSRVEAGEEVVITRGGVAVATLVPARPTKKREAGTMRGLIGDVPNEVFAPLDDEGLRELGFEA